MSNVLSEEKKQQVIALGKLGWPLRRIEKATGVRRETAGAYLKAAGITVDGPGRRGSPAKPAIGWPPTRSQNRPRGRWPPLIRPFSQNRHPTSRTDFPPALRTVPETIELGLSRPQRYLARHGHWPWFQWRYNTVKRFVGKPGFGAT
jgi:hypothetical protein